MTKESESGGLGDWFIKHPIVQIILILSAPFFWLGQWADTRDVSVSIYEGLLSSFTHKIELEKLNEVRVGANLKYLEEVFGDARLIKQSTRFPQAQYRYYHDNKYLLTLAVTDGRVLGYQIISLVSDFYPQIPFSEYQLGKSKLAEIQRLPGEFISDYANIRYYLEPTVLGPDGLFLERQLGYIEYGKTALQASDTEDSLKQLNTLMMKASDTSELITTTNELREKLVPNIISIGDISLEQAGDMLLTRYEYRAHFGQAGDN